MKLPQLDTRIKQRQSCLVLSCHVLSCLGSGFSLQERLGVRMALIYPVWSNKGQRILVGYDALTRERCTQTSAHECPFSMKFCNIAAELFLSARPHDLLAPSVLLASTRLLMLPSPSPRHQLALTGYTPRSRNTELVLEYLGQRSEACTKLPPKMA